MKCFVNKAIIRVTGIILVFLSILFLYDIWLEATTEKLEPINLKGAGQVFYAATLEGGIVLPRDGAQAIGYAWIEGVLEGRVIFPSDKRLSEAERWHAFLQEQWRNLRVLAVNENDTPYFDANIWTVVKNIPESPPENLVILATRNIDPTSLRTRLSDDDMCKHIRFDKDFVVPQHLPILKRYAAVIKANGSSISFPVIPSNSKKTKYTTYGYIYKGGITSVPAQICFDLTTNLVDGLQVKYLTPNGEIIPIND